MKSGEYDIFISYNEDDRDAALHLAELLHGRSVKVWIDRRIQPGQNFIRELESALASSRAIAILFGPHGVSDWQQKEIDTAIHASNRVPPIPILLPGSEDTSIPAFLRSYAWVDFRDGFDDGPFETLIEAITKRQSLETAAHLVKPARPAATERPAPEQWIDSWGSASVKSWLHALSEIVAEDASKHADRASSTYRDGTLSTIVPLAVEMRWWRGYGRVLDLLLTAPRIEQYLGDFSCEAIPDLPVAGGLLSATSEDDRIVVALDGQAAAVVTAEPRFHAAILKSVNGLGRLRHARTLDETVLDRIRDIPIRDAGEVDEATAALLRNREALAAVIARLRIPGGEWLFVHDEEAGETWQSSEFRLN